jgi:hypothetical protein
MVVLAEPSPRRAWRAFDIGVIVLTSLSGPFALLLAPVAAARWYFQRQRWILCLTCLLLGGALVQGYCFVSAPHSRDINILGATPALFCHLLGGRVFLSSIIGSDLHHYLLTQAPPFIWSAKHAGVVALAGLAAVLYAFWKGPLELRLFIVFAAGLFVSALLSPAASQTEPQWRALVFGAGNRYWLTPMVCFMTAVVFCASRSSPAPLRVVALCILALTPLGMIRDWKYPPHQDVHFRENALAFDRAPEGTTVTIPLYPGEPWKMKLTKH